MTRFFTRHSLFKCLRQANALPIYAEKPETLICPVFNLGSETDAFGVGFPNIAEREELENG